MRSCIEKARGNPPLVYGFKSYEKCDTEADITDKFFTKTEKGNQDLIASKQACRGFEWPVVVIL